MSRPTRRGPLRGRSLAATIAAVLGLVALVGPVAARALAAPERAVTVLRIEGRGHGHGVGLSQWGAYTMARDGASAGQILARFYPGTSLGTGDGQVVVVVDRDQPAVRVRLPQGGEIRSARSGAQAEGFPIAVAPGAVVTVTHDGGSYRVHTGADSGSVTATSSASGSVPTTGSVAPAQEDCVVFCEPEPEPEDPPEDDCVVCTTTTTAPPGGGDPDDPGQEPGPGPGPAPAPAPSPEAGSGHPSPTPVWAIPDGGTVELVDRGRAYRGAMEVTALGGSPDQLRARNHLHVENYLRGMAEVPGHWPPAAVQAQTIAARTFALRAMAAGGEICDSESCQVYAGVAHESPGQDAAVASTSGIVVTYHGALASTFYSSSGGGHSATVAEGFGATYDVPYLQAFPYETDNPKPWNLEVSLTDVADRLDYPGTVTDAQVTATGPSGRATGMVLHGDQGTVDVDPQEFRRELGLQSTLFTLERAEASVAPPPPPAPVGGTQQEPAGARVGGAAPSGGGLRVPGMLHGATASATDVAAPADEVAAPIGAPGPSDERPFTPVIVAVAVLFAAGAATMNLWADRRRPGPSSAD